MERLWPANFAAGSALGPFSNLRLEFNQSALIFAENGQLRFVEAAIARPIFILPPEILGKIFMQCLPDDEFITPDATTAPILLCGVCRQWRMVALATPQLFSSTAAPSIWK
ncbi:hypothetical protein DFH07DRAFT_149032 [Mycena maculata]|uniref:F-box domain-containing protein n=1 Tax=Mycena maculata TaxID=230809 RepID=A0AAD7K045_9AGAR|nr:hypothetical protein DFH07DRAFT_149032 [Mycena maculata]